MDDDRAGPVNLDPIDHSQYKIASAQIATPRKKKWTYLQRSETDPFPYVVNIPSTFNQFRLDMAQLSPRHILSFSSYAKDTQKHNRWVISTFNCKQTNSKPSKLCKTSLQLNLNTKMKSRHTTDRE